MGVVGIALLDIAIDSICVLISPDFSPARIRREESNLVRYGASDTDPGTIHILRSGTSIVQHCRETLRHPTLLWSASLPLSRSGAIDELHSWWKRSTTSSISNDNDLHHHHPPTLVIGPSRNVSTSARPTVSSPLGRATNQPRNKKQISHLVPCRDEDLKRERNQGEKEWGRFRISGAANFSDRLKPVIPPRSARGDIVGDEPGRPRPLNVDIDDDDDDDGLRVCVNVRRRRTGCWPPSRLFWPWPV